MDMNNKAFSSESVDLKYKCKPDRDNQVETTLFVGNLKKLNFTLFVCLILFFFQFLMFLNEYLLSPFFFKEESEKNALGKH